MGYLISTDNILTFLLHTNGCQIINLLAGFNATYRVLGRWGLFGDHRP